ncbi:MAG: hemerythrin domain-containing protein [Alphaproteobacteria bacterium]|nr:hemerythrin domain-containing protein [Alphaproteobacteria bacterium]
MADILAILRQDHINMLRLLDALERQIDTFAGGRQPDFEIVSGIATYILEYPDRFHHPVEDLVLAELRLRDASAAKPSEGLESEHERIGQLARDFHTAVETLISDEPARRADFLDTARAFVVAMRDHISHEDREFFPAVEAALTSNDLDRLTSRLPKLDDPLFGAADRDSYVRLRQNILEWSAEKAAGSNTKAPKPVTPA